MRAREADGDGSARRIRAASSRGNEPPNQLGSNSMPDAGPTPQEIQTVIARYAQAYGDLQTMQELSRLIPIGDQKTGAIAEFYARLYLEQRYPEARIRFGGHSESGWDLEVTPDVGGALRIQVKGVSAYSTTRRISPIKSGWDLLYLVYLGRDFLPLGFWVVEDPSIMQGGVLAACCCPDPVSGRGGSTRLKLGTNRIEEFMAAVGPVIRGTG
jgi:hypothetical protein